MSAAGRSDLRQPNFGKASAAKRGRNPRFPYVPIIDYGPQEGVVPCTRTEQIRKRAFATREEAIACAQRVIERNIAVHERTLVTPRYRALREQCGLPRELVGVEVTTTEPDASGQHLIGVVVHATAEERAEGYAVLGVPIDGLVDCSLVEWPDGRRWQRPEHIRIVRR